MTILDVILSRLDEIEKRADAILCCHQVDVGVAVSESQADVPALVAALRQALIGHVATGIPERVAKALGLSCPACGASDSNHTCGKVNA